MTAATVRLILRCPVCDTVASVLEGNETVYLADHAMRCVPRPLGVLESNGLRHPETGKFPTPDNLGSRQVVPGSTPGQAASEAGGASASDTTSGGFSAADIGPPSPAPGISYCRQCGTELTELEAARTNAGKFTLLCRDCTLLALGLL